MLQQTRPGEMPALGEVDAQLLRLQPWLGSRFLCVKTQVGVLSDLPAALARAMHLGQATGGRLWRA